MCDNINNMINQIDGVIEPEKKADDSCDDTYHDLKAFITGTHQFVTENYETKTQEYINAALRQFKMDLKLEDRFKTTNTTMETLHNSTLLLIR